MERALIILCLIGTIAHAQVVSWLDGECPQVTTKEGFDIASYMGKWYELEKYPNSFQKGDCGVAEYVLQDDGIVAVNNTERKPDGFAGTAIGQARDDPSSTDPARLQVRFSKWAPWGKYWVLDTDYTSYSVVYSCTDYIVRRVEFLWILGRKTNLSEATRQQISSLLTNFKIDESKLRVTDHSQQKCAGFE